MSPGPEEELGSDHQSERSLRARDRRTLQFLEQLPVAVFVIDAKGAYVFSNETSTQLLGIEPNPSVALAAGMDAHVAKPIDRLELQATIARLIEATVPTEAEPGQTPT